MKLSTQTHYLEQIFGFKRAIDLLSQAGYDALDFTSLAKPEFCTDALGKDFYIQIRKYAEDKGLTFNQAHGPDGSSFADTEKTKKRFDEIICSMKNASYLGAKTIVIHPCQHLNYYERGNAEKLFEYNLDFYRRLIPYCEEFEIKVAVENMWQYPSMISHSTCSRPDEFIRYVDEINNDCIVGCLDIGHAVLVREKPDDFIRALKNKRLTNLHVHDVDGVNDLHTLPYFGITNWEEIMDALAEIDYKGDLTYEADNFLKGKPIELIADYITLMAKTGKYLIKQFEEKSYQYKTNL